MPDFQVGLGYIVHAVGLLGPRHKVGYFLLWILNFE